jgi:hypothetical protein
MVVISNVHHCTAFVMMVIKAFGFHNIEFLEACTRDMPVVFFPPGKVRVVGNRVGICETGCGILRGPVVGIKRWKGRKARQICRNSQSQCTGKKMFFPRSGMEVSLT